MEPANSILKLFEEPGRKGTTVVAHLLGVHPSAPYRWINSKEKGGTGGTIPQWHHSDLLRVARDRGLPLRPEHFLPEQTPDFGSAA